MIVRPRRWKSPATGKMMTVYRMHYSDPFTKERKRIKLEATNERDAWEEANERWEKLRTGRSDAENSITLKQLLDTHSQRAGIRERTVKSERCHARPLLKYFGEHKPALSITTADVEAYKSHRLVQSIKPRTINISLELLRAAMNRALDHDSISKLPCKIKKLPEPPSQVRFLSHTEIARLIQNAEGRYADAILVMGSLGLGPSEAFRITWKDVDLKNELLKVERYKRGAQGKTRVDYLPMPREVVKMFKARPREGDKVFRSTVRNYLSTAIRSAAKRARIAHPETITPYSLRHSFATNLLQHGVSIADTQALMRHSTPVLTLKYYAHSTLTGMRSAVQKIAPARHKGGTRKLKK